MLLVITSLKSEDLWNLSHRHCTIQKVLSTVKFKPDSNNNTCPNSHSAYLYLHYWVQPTDPITPWRDSMWRVCSVELSRLSTRSDNRFVCNCQNQPSTPKWACNQFSGQMTTNILSTISIRLSPDTVQHGQHTHKTPFSQNSWVIWMKAA